jgi:hypothetical protein
VLRDAVAAALDRVARMPAAESVAAALGLVDGARRVDVGFDRWGTQNRVFELWRTLPDARPLLLPLAEALDFDLPAEG